jgi:hypothetical protein
MAARPPLNPPQEGLAAASTALGGRRASQAGRSVPPVPEGVAVVAEEEVRVSANRQLVIQVPGDAKPVPAGAELVGQGPTPRMCPGCPACAPGCGAWVQRTRGALPACCNSRPDAPRCAPCKPVTKEVIHRGAKRTADVLCCGLATMLEKRRRTVFVSRLFQFAAEVWPAPAASVFSATKVRVRLATRREHRFLRMASA